MIRRIIASTMAPAAMMAWSLCAAPVVADDKPEEMTDALEIVKKVDAAAKEVETAQFHVEFSGQGDFADRIGQLSGDYIIQGWQENAGPKRFFADVKVSAPGLAPRTHLTVGADGENFYLIDHAEKKAYEDIDPNVVGRRGRMVMGGAMFEFVHPTPFSDEINAKKLELMGSKDVEGEPCYEVRVNYSVNDSEAVWCFSKNDFLPRSRFDKIELPSGEKGGRLRIISKLDVNPKVEDDAFKLKMPEGFEKIDDFAP